MKISHYILSYLRLDKRIFCPRYDGVYYAYTFGSNDFGKFDHFMFYILIANCLDLNLLAVRV